MCSCKKWIVTYPDGRTEIKNTATEARTAAARVVGATWKREP